MNIRQLKLEIQTNDENPKLPSAGWLPSSDPAEWLKEATQWRKNGASKDLQILPLTLTDHIRGAVILLPEGGEWLLGPRVQPLIQISPNVFAPEKTQLNAKLLDHEINYLFPSHLYLYLPGLGLISFNKEQILPPSAFITGITSQTSWNHAVSPPPEPAKLTTILIPLPSEENFNIEELNDDGIGELSDQKIKSKKNESNLPKTIGKGIGLGIGALALIPILGLGKIINLLPDGPESISPSLFDKLEAWASQNLKNLTDARQRELDKLMNLMEKDPELGLRYALPLGGHEGRRGRSAPGWQLGLRNLKLGSNQGGGTADGWDLNYETQITLERQYRKAAAHAEAQKKFERAAYIYGELLNDWSSSAEALKKAGRHRDAVAIYLHKLNSKPLAAKCLEESGQLMQAADLYREMKMFEKAGDLYNQLKLTKQAEQAWEKAVENERNPLDKARITISKLNDLDQALSILDHAWRNRDQAIKCLQRQFSYLHTAGREDESINLLEDTFNEKTLMNIEKSRLYYSLLQRNPSGELQHRSKEFILKITSEALLESPNSFNSKELLKSLPSLQKGDVLLKRDSKRYSLQNTEIKSIQFSQRSGSLEPHYILKIPLDAQWQSLAVLADNISIAGCDENMLTVAQVQNRSCHSSQLKTQDYLGGRQKIQHLGLISPTAKARVFHFEETKKIHFRSLNKPRTQTHDNLGTIPNILAIGPSGASDFIALSYSNTGAITVHRFNSDGEKCKTEVLDLAPPDITKSQWLCAERDNHSCFSANQFAAWRYPKGEIIPIQLNESVHKLVFSPADSPIKALLSGTTDICLITPNKAAKKPEFVNLFTSGNSYTPIACYTNSGDIIIACGSNGIIYTSEQIVDPAATFNFPEKLGHAVDITSCGPRGFVILTSKSHLVFFK